MLAKRHPQRDSRKYKQESEDTTQSLHPKNQAVRKPVSQTVDMLAPMEEGLHECQARVLEEPQDFGAEKLWQPAAPLPKEAPVECDWRYPTKSVASSFGLLCCQSFAAAGYQVELRDLSWADELCSFFPGRPHAGLDLAAPCSSYIPESVIPVLKCKRITVS